MFTIGVSLRMRTMTSLGLYEYSIVLRHAKESRHDGNPMTSYASIIPTENTMLA